LETTAKKVRVSPVLAGRLRHLARTSEALHAALTGLPSRELPSDAAGRAELLRYTRKLLRGMKGLTRSSRELSEALAQE
jgi:hypothetical protein